MNPPTLDNLIVMPASDRHRIGTLDALRGISAFAVVIHHTLVTLPALWAIYADGSKEFLPDLLGYTPLHLIWAGPEAVTIFFVLSGLVLSLPFWRGHAESWGKFTLKRIVRLYPPYLAAVVIGGALMTLLYSGSKSDLSVWFNSSWNKPLSWNMALDHFLMLASPQYNVIDGPIWTLAIEMQMSLIFPPLLWAIARSKYLPIPLSLMLAAAAHQFNLPPLCHYAWLFVFGIEISRHEDAVKKGVGSLSPLAQRGIIIAALLLIVSRWILGPFLSSTLSGMASPFLIGTGAAILTVMAAYAETLRPALSWRPMQWLGRISYSLYLAHFIILYTMIYALDGRMPLWLILCCVPVISLLAAELLYVVVERPSILWTKKISKSQWPG